jgi:hypothetical protein
VPRKVRRWRTESAGVDESDAKPSRWAADRAFSILRGSTATEDGPAAVAELGAFDFRRHGLTQSREDAKMNKAEVGKWVTVDTSVTAEGKQRVQWHRGSVGRSWPGSRWSAAFLKKPWRELKTDFNRATTAIRRAGGSAEKGQWLSRATGR